MSKNNFHVGDEVVFVASNMHECGSQWYPEVGIIGVIKEVYELDNDGAPDLWYVNHTWIELACPDQGEFEKSDLPISFLLDAEV